ncbi:MAG: hypothetical protein ACREL7_04310 [Longimicrobiales bacterium]
MHIRRLNSRPRSILPILVLLVVSSCVRSAAVEPPRPTYAIEVRNTLDVDMLVSYDAGDGTRALGAVTPGGTERFVIAVTEPGTIQVSARSSDGARTSGPWATSIAAGTTPTVTLR